MLRILLVLVLLPLPGRACEMALLLAIDVSGSIDAGEYALQVKGLADALDDPEIAGVLVQGQVALAVVQWSGVGAQALVPPRTPKRDRAGVARLAADARARPRAFAASDTAAGQAISFSAAQFAAVPECRRQVIGISTYGRPRWVAFYVGDPPRKIITRSLPRLMQKRARIQYHALYHMNVATLEQRKGFIARINGVMAKL
jgi:Ca-activated chloride channel family protein